MQATIPWSDHHHWHECLLVHDLHVLLQPNAQHCWFVLEWFVIFLVPKHFCWLLGSKSTPHDASNLSQWMMQTTTGSDLLNLINHDVDKSILVGGHETALQILLFSIIHHSSYCCFGLALRELSRQSLFGWHIPVYSPGILIGIKNTGHHVILVQIQ